MDISIATTAVVETPSFLWDRPPLTTLWTPSISDCYSRWWLSGTASSGFPYVVSHSTEDPSFSRCRPQATEAVAPTFSPGVCPSGMTIAQAQEYLIATNQNKIWSGMCCPSGLTSKETFCDGTLSTEMTVYLANSAYATFLTSSGNSVFTTSSLASLSFGCPLSLSSCDSTVVTTASLQADPIFVFWGQEDLEKFPAEYASSAASVVGFEGFTASSSTPGPTPESPPMKDNTKGLSAGAIAGVVIGTLAGLALLIVAVWFLLRRRRQKVQNPSAYEADRPVSQFQSLHQYQSYQQSPVSQMSPHVAPQHASQFSQPVRSTPAWDTYQPTPTDSPKPERVETPPNQNFSGTVDTFNSASQPAELGVNQAEWRRYQGLNDSPAERNG